LTQVPFTWREALIIASAHVFSSFDGKLLVNPNEGQELFTLSFGALRKSLSVCVHDAE
jgi:hypothetical protein